MQPEPWGWERGPGELGIEQKSKALGAWSCL